jgi:hypothetical protein
MSVAKTAKGIPNAGKKQIVVYLCIPKADIIQAMGNGKNNMVVLYRQECITQVFNPFSLLGVLTLWTMPVATTVIAVAHFTP